MKYPRQPLPPSTEPACRHRRWDVESKAWLSFWDDFNTFKKCRKCGLVVITRPDEFRYPTDVLDGNPDRVIRDQPGPRSWWSKRTTGPHRPMRNKDRLRQICDLEAEWKAVSDRVKPHARGKVFRDFYGRYTMAQIAEVVGLSRERVRQLIKKANRS